MAFIKQSPQFPQTTDLTTGFPLRNSHGTQQGAATEERSQVSCQWLVREIKGINAREWPHRNKSNMGARSPLLNTPHARHWERTQGGWDVAQPQRAVADVWETRSMDKTGRTECVRAKIMNTTKRRPIFLKLARLIRDQNDYSPQVTTILRQD